ncbi:MAG: outer membrane protein assembly factor BamB family protein [Planctomycetota bacterium]|jgi:outer membrane protein assembly factor BamB/tetratricopeptide (TPR) repeat protein
MAFKGDLKNISLFDVLQTLQQNKQSGVLVVQREGITRKVFIDPMGVRLFYSRFARPLRLGEIFVRRGRIRPQDVEILLLQQKQSYRPVGELLVESGKVEQWEVDEILQYHAEDEIYGLFGWDTGTFSFYDGQQVEDQGSTPVSEPLMDPASLCLEAARRLDEMERLRQTIPDSEAYYIQAGPRIEREGADERAVALFDAMTEPNSLDELRDLVGMSLYNVMIVAGGFVRDGLLRPLEAGELLEAGRIAEAAGEFQRAAEMFEKSHELDPSNATALEESIRAIQRLEDPKRLAKHLRALGQLRLELGQAHDGTDMLEQSLRHDPDNQETMHVLVEAFSRQGDHERASELSLKMARALTDDGNLYEAIEACRSGLASAPDSITLRYQLAQLLVRGDRAPDAQQELRRIVAETKAHASSSRRAHELLLNCYRLLLRIDPEDGEAADGMRGLDRQRVNTMRKRGLLMRGVIAGAAVILLGVVGVVVMKGDGPDGMLADAERAYQAGDLDKVREIAYRMLDEFPDEPATHKAQGFRKQLVERKREADAVRTRSEKAINEEYNETWDEVRAALNESDYLEALTLVEPFLNKVAEARVAFMRPALKAQFEYEFDAFLDRALKRFNSDRQQIALAEYQLRKTEHSTEALRELETKLGHVRDRKWPALVPQLFEGLRRVAAAKHAGKATGQIGRFVKLVEGAYSSFSNVDHLYFTVRRKRLRREVTLSVAEAREKRLELLRHCEFVRARELYQIAFNMADAIADEQPREYFIDLIKWLEQTNTREDMKTRRDELDTVIRSLAEVARLKEAGQTAAAYRAFRPLVLRYRVVQFEREFKMPFLITSTPKGAEILLDGQKVGVTPLPVELDIVKRTEVTVRRAGFADSSVVLNSTDPSLTGELKAQLRKETTWARTIGGRVEARPVMAGKILLVATSNANLLAINLEDGGVIWEASTRLLDRIAAAPVPMGDHAALITVGGRLHSVRLEDGQVDKKTLKLPGQVRHDAAFDGTTLYVATGKRRLLAIRDGKIVYNKQLAQAPSTRVLIHQGQLFIGTAEGRILVHDAKTGLETRKLRASDNTSFLGGIETHGALVVAGAEDGMLYAFDPKVEKELWHYRTGGPVEAAPLSSKGLLYLPGADGKMHVIDAKGRHDASYDMHMPSKFAPAMENGFLYATAGTRVVAFDADSRQPWWEFVLDKGDGEPEHVVARDGVVVIITSNSRVVAFPADSR